MQFCFEILLIVAKPKLLIKVQTHMPTCPMYLIFKISYLWFKAIEHVFCEEMTFIFCMHIYTQKDKCGKDKKI